MEGNPILTGLAMGVVAAIAFRLLRQPSPQSEPFKVGFDLTPKAV